MELKCEFIWSIVSEKKSLHYHSQNNLFVTIIIKLQFWRHLSYLWLQFRINLHQNHHCSIICYCAFHKRIVISDWGYWWGYKQNGNGMSCNGNHCYSLCCYCFRIRESYFGLLNPSLDSPTYDVTARLVSETSRIESYWSI